jgi:hypothetical protein
LQIPPDFRLIFFLPQCRLRVAVVPRCSAKLQTSTRAVGQWDRPGARTTSTPTKSHHWRRYCGPCDLGPPESTGQGSSPHSAPKFARRCQCQCQRQRQCSSPKKSQKIQPSPPASQPTNQHHRLPACRPHPSVPLSSPRDHRRTDSPVSSCRVRPEPQSLAAADCDPRPCR